VDVHSTYGPCVIVCLNGLYVIYVSGVTLIDNSCNFIALVMNSVLPVWKKRFHVLLDLLQSSIFFNTPKRKHFVHGLGCVPLASESFKYSVYLILV
jgi:hypothetical protein